MKHGRTQLNQFNDEPANWMGIVGIRLCDLLGPVNTCNNIQPKIFLLIKKYVIYKHSFGFILI